MASVLHENGRERWRRLAVSTTTAVAVGASALAGCGSAEEAPAPREIPRVESTNDTGIVLTCEFDRDGNPNGFSHREAYWVIDAIALVAASNAQSGAREMYVRPMIAQDETGSTRLAFANQTNGGQMLVSGTPYGAEDAIWYSTENPEQASEADACTDNLVDQERDNFPVGARTASMAGIGYVDIFSTSDQAVPFADSYVNTPDGSVGVTVRSRETVPAENLPGDPAATGIFILDQRVIDAVLAVDDLREVNIK